MTEFDKAVAKLLQPFGVLPEHISSGACNWNAPSPGHHVSVNVNMPNLTPGMLNKMSDVLGAVGFCHSPEFNEESGKGTIILRGDPSKIRKVFNTLSVADRTRIQDYAREKAAGISPS